MLQAIITFDIIEYLPSDFKFDNFSFIISSENRDFEQEISYMNKNQITHKANIHKKDLKYSIKATKNNSLIGISDLIIPSHIISKKESTFDKTCSITMTDSIKRVLFGNTSSSNFLKINIHMTLQYKEKEVTSKHMFANSGKDPKSQKESGTNSVIISQRNQLVNKKIENLRKQRSNSKPKSSIKSQIIKPKTQIIGNNKLKEVQKAILDEDINDEYKNNKNDSFIDSELNKEVNEINPEFTNFLKYFNNKYPLDKLNSYNDVNEMMEYTKNIAEELLDYQLKYYNIFYNTFSVKNKFKQLLIQYNDKLRAIKKEINKLDEENDLYEIKEEYNNKNNYNDVKDILFLKENELDNFKELYGNYLEKKVDDNSNVDNEKIKNEEKTQNLLIKVLAHSINKYGPINKILTPTNSTETERLNLKRLANKYNIPLNNQNEGEQNKNNENNDENDNKNIGSNEEKNEEYQEENQEEEINEENANDNSKPQNIFDGKITKWEYVSTERPDKIDKKLEQYLKFFYSKRTFPKVIFRKTSTNNYEYGTQKIMIKIEGDTIRVRYVGGYLLIDKFIELNSASEEKKLKKQNEKNNNAGIGGNKKNIYSTKKK